MVVQEKRVAGVVDERPEPGLAFGQRRRALGDALFEPLLGLLDAASAFLCSVISMPISRIMGEPSTSVNGRS